ncbi:MAG: bifunctional 2-C-methyl-D-erythritol 4-phosphate cytidylyltransferase/2-C-methyl-D-erythritol 2,4-cyclodiphosphate synthase [Sphingomicrobium sp.]
MTTTALIMAAGTGERFGGGIAKQYRLLGGKSVLAHAVDALAAHPAIAAVRVVVGAGQEHHAREALADRDVGDLVTGGATRAQSVSNGLAAIAGDAVLVHDAARPFCPRQVIDRLISALEFHDGAAPVIAVGDTIARSNGMLNQALDRDGLVRIQTPQAARLTALRKAYDDWTGKSPTDETSVLRAAGMTVAAVTGSPLLDKITGPADFARAEQWLHGAMIPRTGIGFDVHAFAGDGPVMLGGISIPHSRGLAGHSDADVVLHALTDALLGAAGLGDIGEHFPPSDQHWKGASSELFLAHAAALVRASGAIIDAMDCTIIAEEPKIGPHRAAMRDRIAAIVGLEPGRVSVKATTTERLGFIGRGEGIAAQAIVNIRMAPLP